MAFRVPSVIVYQEFLTSTPTVTAPFFDLCIVGPCYQVIEKTECAKFVASANKYKSSYPGLRADANIDKDFTAVRLSNIYVKIWPQSKDAKKFSDAIVIDNSGYDKTNTLYTENVGAYNSSVEQYAAAYQAWQSAKAAYEEDPSEENEQLLNAAKDVLNSKSGALDAIVENIGDAFDGLTRVTGKTVRFSTDRPEVGDILDVTYSIGTPGTDRYAEYKISTAIQSVSKDYDTIVLAKNIYDPSEAYGPIFGDLDYTWEEPPKKEEKEAIKVVGLIRRATNSANVFQPTMHKGEPTVESAVNPWTAWYTNVYTGEVKDSILGIEDPNELMKWSANQGFELNEGLKVATAATEGEAAFIATADVDVTFRALRQDIANDFITISSYSQAKGILGELNYNNPLSVAAYMVSQAMSDVRYKVLPIAEDEDTGYMAALDILSNDEDVYVIVPLTQSKNVVAAYANHCTSMSRAEKSMWRCCFASQPMPATKIIVERGTGKFVPGTAGTMFLKDNEGAFVTNAARPGDFIDVYVNDTDGSTYRTYSYKLINVVNDSVAKVSTVKHSLTGTEYLELDESLGAGDFGPENKGVDVIYEVVRALDVQGQADTISEIAQSFNNKRLRLVYPDTILLNLNDVTYMTPSYYMCVTLGAMRAGYPPHQGFSTMGLSGVSRIYHSNKYFTDDQLADMAGNGVFWVCQDAVEALPYVLYQTTTCTDSLETAEDSCVATVDYASKFYRNNLKNVLGKYNVNTISLKYATNIINACSDQLTTTKYEFIGSILKSASLINIVGVKDKIKPTIKIEIPYPVNGIDVTLQV